jgi:hypothetical protein
MYCIVSHTMNNLFILPLPRRIVTISPILLIIAAWLLTH